MKWLIEFVEIKDMKSGIQTSCKKMQHFYKDVCLTNYISLGVVRFWSHPKSTVKYNKEQLTNTIMIKSQWVTIRKPNSRPAFGRPRPKVTIMARASMLHHFLRHFAYFLVTSDILAWVECSISYYVSLHTIWSQLIL